MKIAFLFPSPYKGGSELAALESLYLLNSKTNHSTLAIIPKDGPLKSEIELTGSAIAEIHYGWWIDSRTWRIKEWIKGLLSFIKSSIHIARALRSSGCDMLVTHTVVTPCGALACLFAGIPHVWYIHEYGDIDHGFRFQYGRNASIGLMGRLSRTVIANSSAVKSAFQDRLQQKKLRLLYYSVGISTECNSKPLELGKNPGVLNIILIGRLAKGKRQKDGIKAISLLKERGIHCVLNLVGSEDPAYGAELRELTRKLGVEEQITFHGFKDNPLPFLLESDLALICSRNEAFGRVTIEAMKMGIPVIGANSGGTAEIIEDGVSGLLYEPGNPAALADSISSLASDRPLLNTLGRAAFSRAHDLCSPSKHITELRTILESSR